ncbi:lipoprotein [Spiroplasma endosymbiont of Cantharis nigra]|uniref:lipoprotein n=1 Tax=Spiroplasma endosymbiont of Cantharis nigra TaxID=3066278 RepID=UPI0030CDF1B6
MKKLLTLLGAFGMLTSAGATVVACGSTGPNIIDPEDDWSEIIEEFNSDLSSLFQDYKDDQLKYLINIETNEATVRDENKLKFFTKSNVESFLNSGKDLTDEQKRDILSDLELTMDKVKLEDEIKLLAKEEKYSILFSKIEGNLLDDFKIVSDIKVISNADSKDEEEAYYANIIFDYEIYVNYSKSSEEKAKFKIEDNFKFTITDSSKFGEIFKDIVENIQKDFLSSVKNDTMTDFANIDFKNLGTDKADLENTDQEIKEYFNKDEYFRDKLALFIDDNYIDNNLSINAKFQNQIITNTKRDIEWQVEYRNEASELTTSTFKDKKEFGKGTKIYNQVSLLTGHDMTTAAGQQKIEEYIEKSTELEEKKFNDKFDEITKDIENNLLLKENVLKVGKIRLNSLTIVTSSGYIHQLPDFSLMMGYYSDESNKRDSEITAKKFKDNIVTAISEFQKIYEVDFSKRNNAFFGGFKDSSVVFKKWNWTNTQWNGREVWENMSLRTLELVQYREELLANSNQSHFDFQLGRNTKGFGVYKTDQRISLSEFRETSDLKKELNLYIEFDYFKLKLDGELENYKDWYENRLFTGLDKDEYLK